MEEKLKILIEQLLRETVPLAEAAAVYDTKFLNTLLGIYRVSLSTLRDIYYLSANIDSGLSMLDLARKILEYMISVEFMIMKGKEDMATRFQDHLWVQAHQELSFLKSIGENPDNWQSDWKGGADEVEKLYSKLNHEDKKRRTWTGKSLEQMLEELCSNGSLKDFDNSRIGQIYIWGSRANHPNPFIVINYLGAEDKNSSNTFYSRLSLMAAISFHIRLTTRYIDEIRLLSGKKEYEDLAQKISAIWQQLEKIEE
jgi:Family of unknown function (DUF5677)